MPDAVARDTAPVESGADLSFADQATPPDQALQGANRDVRDYLVRNGALPS